MTHNTKYLIIDHSGYSLFDQERKYLHQFVKNTPRIRVLYGSVAYNNIIKRRRMEYMEHICNKTLSYLQADDQLIIGGTFNLEDFIRKCSNALILKTIAVYQTSYGGKNGLHQTLELHNKKLNSASQDSNLDTRGRFAFKLPAVTPSRP
jgi:stalled ribosome rescue protein Dom34